MGAIGLGGLVLALAASYWLARRTSLRMQSIADALVQMVHAPHSQPNLLHIQKLHQQSHGPVQQLAGAVLAFRRALQRQHQAEEQALELLFYDPLTQLPNRRLLRERLQQALTRPAGTAGAGFGRLSAHQRLLRPPGGRPGFASRGPAPAHHHPGL